MKYNINRYSLHSVKCLALFSTFDDLSHDIYKSIFIELLFECQRFFLAYEIDKCMKRKIKTLVLPFDNIVTNSY